MKDVVYKYLSRPDFASCAVALASVSALGAALTAQYGFGLQPCTLCLYQRVPYVLAILLGLAGFIAAKHAQPRVSAFLVFLCALVFLAGGVIAAYHSGVEQHWWQSFLEGCHVDFGAASGADLLKKIQSTQAARCDEIPWADPVFGFSMAVWNIFVSGALFIASLISSILIARRANGFLD